MGQHVVPVFCVYLWAAVHRAVNIGNLPTELWHRTLSFVDMKDPEAGNLRSLDLRTYQFYYPDYAAIHRLESIIYRSGFGWSSTVDYELIWNLSKQIQLSRIGDIKRRGIQVHRYVIGRISEQHAIFLHYPEARRLMHALGMRSISIHEYDALTLDVDHMNLTESGKQKLKLLLLASRGSEYFLTAVLNVRNSSSSFHVYNQIVCMPNPAGFPVWMWFHFPWISAPEMTYYQSHSFLLYFGALYEFLWTRFHDEFAFPEYDSMFYVTDLDDDELVKKVDFVKFMMDRHHFRIHEKFSDSKKEMVRWMDRCLYSKTDRRIVPGWVRVKRAQKSFFWIISEAVRLNELLMSANETLSDQFLMEYILSVSAQCGLNLNMRPEQILYIETVITHLMDFNGDNNAVANAKLRDILRVIRANV